MRVQFIAPQFRPRWSRNRPRRVPRPPHRLRAGTFNPYPLPFACMAGCTDPLSDPLPHPPEHARLDSVLQLRRYGQGAIVRAGRHRRPPRPKPRGPHFAGRCLLARGSHHHDDGGRACRLLSRFDFGPTRGRAAPIPPQPRGPLSAGRHDAAPYAGSSTAPNGPERSSGPRARRPGAALIPAGPSVRSSPPRNRS